MAKAFVSTYEPCPKCNDKDWDNEQDSVYVLIKPNEAREYYVIFCHNCKVSWLSGFCTVLISEIN